MNKIPNGFRVAGVACGIKSKGTEDIALIVAERPCVVAGVYTTNQVVAAPVVLDRERTPSAHARAVVVNSGNANACTGELGMENARRMTALAASHVGCAADQALVMSTGIIGQQLPMEKVEAGIADAAAALGNSEAHLLAAARGIMTTDTKTKLASVTNGGYTITGIAKGSGMIGPNMATMLGVVLTDAVLTPETAQRLLAGITERSFNSINVDGHTSTNDTVLLLASGAAHPMSNKDAMDQFAQDLETVCVDLAKQIVIDGEGATHLVEISITGAATDADARTIAQAIANSPLVKTAFAGNDPNWGRIVSAAGYAGPQMDIAHASLQLNGITLFEHGTPATFDAPALAQNMRDHRDMLVELSVGQGRGAARYWTCDLTHEYVTINADYHT